MEKITIGQEVVHLKKGFEGEWRVVHPIKNEDGSWNWFNLLVGGKSNLIFLIVLLLVGITIYWGYNEMIANYKIIADNPCSFCSDCQQQTRDVISKMSNTVLGRKSIDPINLTILNTG